MPKLKFQASANREELLRKYSNSDSVEIGPKALPLTSREDVEKILQAFDDGYKKLIENILHACLRLSNIPVQNTKPQ